MSDPARELIIGVNNDAKTVTIRSGTTIITVSLGEWSKAIAPPAFYRGAAA